MNGYGFVDREKIIMNYLVEAYNEFHKLPSTHPSEKGDFSKAIHLCQQLLAMRVVRRDYPETYYKL